MQALFSACCRDGTPGFTWVSEEFGLFPTSDTIRVGRSAPPDPARRCYDPPSLMLRAFRPLFRTAFTSLALAASGSIAGCAGSVSPNLQGNGLRVGGLLEGTPRSEDPASSNLRARDARGVLSDLVVETAQCAAPSSSQLSRDEALADFDVVARILERGYAGFDVLERRGQDWGAVFAAARHELLAGPKQWDSEQWVDWLAQTFASTDDEYLSFWSVRHQRADHRANASAAKRGYAPDLRLMASRRGWAVLDPVSRGLPRAAVLVGCEVAGHSVVLQPTIVGSPPRAAWMPVVFDDESPEEIECVFYDGRRELIERTLSVHSLRMASAERRGSSHYSRRSESPAWLELRGRPNAHADGSLERFVASAQELRREQVIVLDLRGNTGGDAGFVRRWFRDLTAGDLGSLEVDSLQSEVTLQGAINSAECRLHAASSPTVIARERRELARLHSELALAEAPFRSVYESGATERGAAPKAFTGRLLVVTDSRCASSCETAVALARKLPGAMIVGETTAGAGEFGQAERYRLPNTGVWMQAPTKWFSGELVPSGGRGFKPDFWMDSRDPDATVKRLARCLGERRCLDKLREGVTMGGAARAATRRPVAEPRPERAMTTDT
jgi:hypothetical protein